MDAETRRRLEAAFTAGFQWGVNGTDRHGDYNGGPPAQGFDEFLAAALPAEPLCVNAWPGLQTAPPPPVERVAFEAGKLAGVDVCSEGCRGISSDPPVEISDYDEWVDAGRPEPDGLCGWKRKDGTSL